LPCRTLILLILFRLSLPKQLATFSSPSGH